MAAVTLLSILIGLPAGGVWACTSSGAKQGAISYPGPPLPFAVAMGIHVAFIRYGLADSLLGVILVHLVPVTPYMVLILASVFANYNPDVEGQARSLGARPRQVLWHITLPAILPGLVVGSLFAFIISWSQYLLTLLIGGRNVITLPILLFSFANGRQRHHCRPQYCLCGPNPHLFAPDVAVFNGTKCGVGWIRQGIKETYCVLRMA
ncbi:MAG: ABC transporter permease subunit [Chloroflexi bacterium]|nr:ABC transporter permease subunit [Chloroflexota bacterium]